MKLEQLRPNFMLMPREEQLAFLNAYREKRHHDLIETTVIKVSTKGKKKATRTGARSKGSVKVTSRKGKIMDFNEAWNAAKADLRKT